jgi:hypothetical protein
LCLLLYICGLFFFLSLIGGGGGGGGQNETLRIIRK